MNQLIQMDTIFYIWEAVMTMGPDGPWPNPQEFPLIHVCLLMFIPLYCGSAHASSYHLQNFFLPVECSEVIFLRTRLCVLYNNGFNLVKLPEWVSSLDLIR